MPKSTLQEIIDNDSNKFTFSEFVKEDIYTNTDYSSTDYKVILYSFFRNNLTIKIGQKLTWIIKSQNLQIIEFILNGLDYFNNLNIEYECMFEPDHLNKTRTNYSLLLWGDLDKLDEILKLFDDANNENFHKDRYCSNFLIGAMLSGGSIAHPLENYHLEIRCDSNNYIPLLTKALARYGLEYKIIYRNKKTIVYFKKSEIISDFLKAIRTQNSLFEFENIRIQRDFNNQQQRLNNLDISNLSKSSKAGVLTKEMILEIKKNHDEFCKQSTKFLKYCELRVQNPDCSLNELSCLLKQMFNIEISKSGLNHFNSRIKEMYEELKLKKLVFKN